MQTKTSEPAEQIPECLVHTWQCCKCGMGPDGKGKVLTAWGLTIALNIATTQSLKRHGPGNGGCWKIYPMCDAWALQDHVRLPSFIGQTNSCEICLFLVAIITCLHWSCVFTLFSQPRWNDKFLHRIITATLITLLPLATIVRDPVTVFLRLLPIVTDVYISACYILDCGNERETDY